jgi:hypothetical protein
MIRRPRKALSQANGRVYTTTYIEGRHGEPNGNVERKDLISAIFYIPLVVISKIEMNLCCSFVHIVKDS